MDHFEQVNPNWGMPFGMPNLSPKEYTTLLSWLQEGAVMNQALPLSAQEQALVTEYEALLNHSSRKNQLAARYIYEHLFLSHLYFSEIAQERPRFFKLIRSSTPPGEPVKRIVTRRPYDDPGVERVYYRLVPEQETIVDKPTCLSHSTSNGLRTGNSGLLMRIMRLPSFQVIVRILPQTRCPRSSTFP